MRRLWLYKALLGQTEAEADFRKLAEQGCARTLNNPGVGPGFNTSDLVKVFTARGTFSNDPIESASRRPLRPMYVWRRLAERHGWD